MQLAVEISPTAKEQGQDNLIEKSLARQFCVQPETCNPRQKGILQVAVKLIKKSAIENKQDLVRIRREIRIMSALNHPNIIQIFEGEDESHSQRGLAVFENKEKIILVMEYASGGELYDYVSTFGSLPESEARRIFRQITSAVLYCHKVRDSMNGMRPIGFVINTRFPL